MDKLQVLIKSLTKEEISGFEQFINRFRIRSNRKDLELFKLLLENEKVNLSDALAILYEGKNEREAYHALRKRLLGYLIEFISLKKYNDRKGGQHYNAEGMFILARYFFEIEVSQAAWFYLLRAIKSEEKKASSNIMADLYLTWLENWGSYVGKDKFDSVYKKYINYRDTQQQETQLKLAVSIIKRKIEQYKLRGKDKSIEDIIKEVTKGLDISKSFIRSPHRLFLFVNIIRSEAIISRDYSGFEKFIATQLKKIEKEETPSNELFFLAELYYFAAHANYKLKNFKRSIDFIEKFKKLSLYLNKTQSSKIKPKISLLTWACQFYTGQLMESIESLNELASEESGIDLYYELDLKLNLATSYFALQNYSRAQEVMLSIHHSLNYLQKKKGLEWRLRFQLIELLIHFEQENKDLVKSKLRGINRKKAEFSQHSQFKNLSIFIDILKESIEDENFDKFKRRIDRFDYKKFNQENIQEIAFYSFIKSKVSNTGFYKTLLNTISDNA